ncbi:hypothetical protein AC1031_010015 [Aphanomyces cochlioides]|nr:hypothetical protein AC1031_010015 [Aphanomyces cochlioides]
MFAKIAVLAACAFAALSQGAAVNSTVNATSPNATIAFNNTLPAAASTEYGREIYYSLLKHLKITHDDSKPLSDDEYNTVVNSLENLLTGKYVAKTKEEKKKLQADIKAVLARISPEEMEQAFADVTFELTVKFFEKTFGEDLKEDDKKKAAVASADTVAEAPASQQTGLNGLTREDIVYIGSAFGGCVLSVAVALAVIGARKQKQAAATKSVLADNVVDEIEAAEEAAGESKDADAEVEDVKTDSPADRQLSSCSFVSSNKPRDFESMTWQHDRAWICKTDVGDGITKTASVS